MKALRVVGKELPRTCMSVAGLTAAIAVLLVVLCLVLVQTSGPHPPSDGELTEKYARHKLEFNELAALLTSQDNRFVVFPDSETCQIAGERIIEAKDDKNCAELVGYFKYLGLEWAYAGGEPLHLPVYGWGLGVSAFRKGYLYTTDESWVQKVGQIVDSTDSRCKIPCFRRIDTNWYIYLDD
jgi:hypothetical protein